MLRIGRATASSREQLECCSFLSLLWTLDSVALLGVVYQQKNPVFVNPPYLDLSSVINVPPHNLRHRYSRRANRVPLLSPAK